MLSITSDYFQSTGCPEPQLRRIAEAGFTHVHWCHHWCTDFLYDNAEIRQIARWLDDFGLKTLDLHGSAGEEKNWTSEREYERAAGIALVENRIEMAARLGADVVIMHLPCEPQEPGAARQAFWDRARSTLDALEATARRCAVRLALENGWGAFETIAQVFEMYGPDYIGLCYDSGHGNLRPDGLEWLERLKGRLASIHLHDNDGKEDLHRLLFTGTIDWPRLARILAESAYGKCVSMEATMNHEPEKDEARFLAEAHRTGSEFARMIEARQALAEPARISKKREQIP